MDKARETLVERLLAPNPIELTLAADDRAVLRQALSARQAEREEAAADLTRLNAKVEELERERLKLRTALIGTGRNLGAFLADDVSSDFLTLLPEEARLLKARLARAVEVRRRFKARALALEIEAAKVHLDEARGDPSYSLDDIEDLKGELHHLEHEFFKTGVSSEYDL